MTFREEVKLLISNSWCHHHTNGSHYIFKNNERGGSIAVPRHNGDIPKRTLKSNLKQISLK